MNRDKVKSKHSFWLFLCLTLMIPFSDTFAGRGVTSPVKMRYADTGRPVRSEGRVNHRNLNSQPVYSQPRPVQQYPTQSRYYNGVPVQQAQPPIPVNVPKTNNVNSEPVQTQPAQVVPEFKSQEEFDEYLRAKGFGF